MWVGGWEGSTSFRVVREVLEVPVLLVDLVGLVYRLLVYLVDLGVLEVPDLHSLLVHLVLLALHHVQALLVLLACPSNQVVLVDQVFLLVPVVPLVLRVLALLVLQVVLGILACPSLLVVQALLVLHSDQGHQELQALPSLPVHLVYLGILVFQGFQGLPSLLAVLLRVLLVVLVYLVSLVYLTVLVDLGVQVDQLGMYISWEVEECSNVGSFSWRWRLLLRTEEKSKIITMHLQLGNIYYESCIVSCTIIPVHHACIVYILYGLQYHLLLQSCTQTCSLCGSFCDSSLFQDLAFDGTNPGIQPHSCVFKVCPGNNEPNTFKQGYCEGDGNEDHKNGLRKKTTFSLLCFHLCVHPTATVVSG